MAGIDDIKELRSDTSMSVTDVKNALEEAKGDMTRAKELLRSRGAEIAQKKQEREAGEGIVETYLHATGKTGVILDLRSETDFVAKSPDFKALAHELVLQIAAMDPESVEELLAQDYVKDPSKKVQNLLEEYIAKLGENIVVKRFSRYQI
ncbi:translation elongation factor Ts [Patescibacteria group bacterium]|nr:translation elongation factor Ts [Patescibacteria group bacterium]